METSLDIASLLDKLPAEEVERLRGYLAYKEPLYVPSDEVPSVTQAAFLRTDKHKEALFGGMAGGGKALSLTTPILTPDGWKTMEAIKPGDFVFGADGRPTEVLAVSDVMHDHDCRRVVFGDGSEIVADAEHLWLTTTDADQAEGDSPSAWSVRTTAEVARTLGAGHSVPDPQRRRITSCEEAASVPVKCIAVAASDSLYLAGEGLVPTHNSSALLMAALQYVDVPGYRALLFRRTLADLQLPSSLMSRFLEWISPHGDVAWNGSTNTAVFPSGATVTFGYLNNKDDYLRYKGVEVHFIGFDEVSEIREADYTYLFSRLRKKGFGPSASLPLRVRSTSNPTNNWVRRRFIVEGKDHGRLFIPSRLEDNPGVDTDSYREMLMEVSPVERERLMNGNWWAEDAGAMFSRRTDRITPPGELPAFGSGVKVVRFWDMAGTEPSATNPDPDWTVGVLMYLEDGVAYVLDVARCRLAGSRLEDFVAAVAEADGRDIPIRAEQEPGSSGKSLADHYGRRVLLGYDYDAIRSTGDKKTRARPLASAWQRGNVWLLEATWTTDVLDEMSSFPAGKHDDIPDAMSGAYNHLTGHSTRRVARIVV